LNALWKKAQAEENGDSQAQEAPSFEPPQEETDVIRRMDAVHPFTEMRAGPVIGPSYFIPACR
jgi:hypothetical protein